MLRARRTRGSGGTGRRARLRGVWFTPYGFKSRFPHQKKGNHFCDCLFSRLGTGQCKPVTALAVRVRLRSKGTIEHSEICSTVPFPRNRLPAFFATETDRKNPTALAVRARLRKQRRYRAKRDMFNCPFTRTGYQQSHLRLLFSFLERRKEWRILS